MNDLPDPVRRELSRRRHQDLKEFVMSEIHETATRSRRRRPALLAGALAGAVALAIAVPSVLGPSAAWAVTDNPDGTITIKINEAKDPKGLQAELRKRGFNVIVDFIPEGKRCMPQPRSTTWVEGVRLASPQTDAEEGGGPGFRIDPSKVGPGQTAVLEFMVQGSHSAGISDRVSAGPVAACNLVDR